MLLWPWLNVGEEDEKRKVPVVAAVRAWLWTWHHHNLRDPETSLVPAMAFQVSSFFCQTILIDMA
jgi:hypothetical protein